MNSTMSNYRIKFGGDSTIEAGERWMDLCVKFAKEAYWDGLSHFQGNCSADLKELCTLVDYGGDVYTYVYICMAIWLLVYMTRINLLTSSSIYVYIHIIY